MAIYALEFVASVGVVGIAVAALVIALHRLPGRPSSVNSDAKSSRMKDKPVTVGLLMLASFLALIVVGVQCTTYLTLEHDPNQTGVRILKIVSLFTFGIASSVSKMVSLLRAYRLTHSIHGRISTAIGGTLSTVALLSSMVVGTLFAIPRVETAMSRDILFLALSLLVASLISVRMSDCIVGLCEFGFLRTVLLSTGDFLVTVGCLFTLALSGFNKTLFFLMNIGAVWNCLALGWETDAQEEVMILRAVRVRASAESFGSRSVQAGPSELEDGDITVFMDEKKLSMTSSQLSIQPLIEPSTLNGGFPVSIHAGDEFEGDRDSNVDVSASELARQAEEEKDQVRSTLAPVAPLNMSRPNRPSFGSQHSLLKPLSLNGRAGGGGASAGAGASASGLAYLRASRASSRISEASRYSEHSTFYEPNPQNLPPPIYLARHKRLASNAASVDDTSAQATQVPSRPSTPSNAGTAATAKINYSRPTRTQP